MDIQYELFQSDQPQIIIGCDEAGRGPLAGPVCASCVILPKDFPFDILNDSKKLSEKKRLYAEKIIKEKSTAWSVAWASPKEIDSINILNATMLAMTRSLNILLTKLNGLDSKNIIMLVDGNKKPDTSVPCQAIVKGDSKIKEIMAASILAKTARDRLMICAGSRWPMYGFEKHKGYPSIEHALALRNYGPCPIHRKTFHVPNVI